LDLGRVLVDGALSDLGSLPEDDTDASTGRSQRLVPSLRTGCVDGLLDRLGRLCELLDEGERIGSCSNVRGEEGEEGFKGGSLEERGLDEVEDAGEDGALDLGEDGRVAPDEGSEGVKGEGKEVDVGVVDEELEVGDERLGGGLGEIGSRLRKEGTDAAERGDLEGAMDLAEENRDLDEALLDPRVECGSLADGRLCDLSNDLDGDESRHLVLETIAEESEAGVKVAGELVSSVEEERSEADDTLALDLFVGIDTRETRHRGRVDRPEVADDTRRDGGDGGGDGSEDAYQVGRGDESFDGNLVELVSYRGDEEGYELGEVVGVDFGVVGAEEESEEGEDFDLEHRRCSRETTVGRLERRFDPGDEGGDLTLETSAEDTDELVEEGESCLASDERLGGELLRDGLGDGWCLCS
jgi:hypothetical protein